jgi:hypothetical protein
MAGCEPNQKITLGQKEIFAAYHERADPFANKGRKSRVYLAWATRVQNQETRVKRS